MESIMSTDLGAFAIAVSPDEKHVYATGYSDIQFAGLKKILPQEILVSKDSSRTG